MVQAWELPQSLHAQLPPELAYLAASSAPMLALPIPASAAEHPSHCPMAAEQTVQPEASWVSDPQSVAEEVVSMAAEQPATPRQAVPHSAGPQSPEHCTAAGLNSTAEQPVQQPALPSQAEQLQGTAMHDSAACRAAGLQQSACEGAHSIASRQQQAGHDAGDPQLDEQPAQHWEAGSAALASSGPAEAAGPLPEQASAAAEEPDEPWVQPAHRSEPQQSHQRPYDSVEDACTQAEAPQTACGAPWAPAGLPPPLAAQLAAASARQASGLQDPLCCTGFFEGEPAIAAEPEAGVAIDNRASRQVCVTLCMSAST